jgi:hypothetical protein
MQTSDGRTIDLGRVCNPQPSRVEKEKVGSTSGQASAIENIVITNNPPLNAYQPKDRWGVSIDSFQALDDRYPNIPGVITSPSAFQAGQLNVKRLRVGFDRTAYFAYGLTVQRQLDTINRWRNADPANADLGFRIGLSDECSIRPTSSPNCVRIAGLDSGYSPLSRSPSDPKFASYVSGFGDWASTVAGLIDSNLKGVPVSIEIWNEPNLTGPFWPLPSQGYNDAQMAKNYARLLWDAVYKIRTRPNCAICATIPIVSGGISSGGGIDFKSYYQNFRTEYEAVRGSNPQDYTYDGLHPYYTWNRYDEFVALRPRKPVFVTEMGDWTAYGGPAQGSRQAKAIIGAIERRVPYFTWWGALTCGNKNIESSMLFLANGKDHVSCDASEPILGPIQPHLTTHNIFKWYTSRPYIGTIAETANLRAERFGQGSSDVAVSVQAKGSGGSFRFVNVAGQVLTPKTINGQPNTSSGSFTVTNNETNSDDVKRFVF